LIVLAGTRRASQEVIAQDHASLPFPIRRSGKLGHVSLLIPLPEEEYGQRFLEAVPVEEGSSMGLRRGIALGSYERHLFQMPKKH